MGLDIEATKQTPFLEEVDGMYFLTLYQMHHPTFHHVECSQHMFLKKNNSENCLTGFYGQSDCSSQLPLLDFMRLPDPEQ